VYPHLVFILQSSATSAENTFQNSDNVTLPSTNPTIHNYSDSLAKYISKYFQLTRTIHPNNMYMHSNNMNKMQIFLL